METTHKKRSKLRKFFSFKNDFGGYRLGKIVATTVIIITLLTTFFVGMFYYIPVGFCGLIVDPINQTVSQPMIGPMYGIKLPYQNLITVYVATDYLGMWGNGSDQYANFPAIACFSRDQLEMQIDLTIRWRLDVSKVRQLYENYPMLNWKETTIASIVREQIRLTTKEFSAVQTIEQRDLVRAKIAEAIFTKLEAEPSLAGAVINFEFELRNIDYPESYTRAIEEKLAAEQQKLQAEYEAQRKIVLAQAEAQALLIAANATAQSKVIEAEGLQLAIQAIVADANMTESEFVDFLNLYITLKALEQMAQSGAYFFLNWENGVPILVPVNP